MEGVGSADGRAVQQVERGRGQLRLGPVGDNTDRGERDTGGHIGVEKCQRADAKDVGCHEHRDGNMWQELQR